MATGYEPNVEGAIAVVIDILDANGFTKTRHPYSPNYRGLVDASTRIDLISTTECIPKSIAGSSRHSHVIKNVVEIVTRDEEMFPVRRKLLRPCIALTSVVQAGRGKYKRNGGNERISIGVEACTFDRVLLYLEHVARGEDFKFDPLIATELLEAAETLGITDLSDRCRKVLGSFEVNVYGEKLLEILTLENRTPRLHSFLCCFIGPCTSYSHSSRGSGV